MRGMDRTLADLLSSHCGSTKTAKAPENRCHGHKRAVEGMVRSFEDLLSSVSSVAIEGLPNAMFMERSMDRSLEDLLRSGFQKIAEVRRKIADSEARWKVFYVPWRQMSHRTSSIRHGNGPRHK